MRRPACFRRAPTPGFPWNVGAVLVGLLIGATVPADLLADTTFDSGTTTIGSGTNFGNTLVIGETGTATVRFVTGANASNVNAMLGYDPTGQGTALVTGGTWTSSNLLFVGYQGSGVLDINGGYVRSVAVGALAWVPGSSGTATVTSGTWSGDSIYVGYRGPGELTVNGGGVVAADYQVNVGTESSGSGVLRIAGGTVTSPLGGGLLGLRIGDRDQRLLERGQHALRRYVWHRGPHRERRQNCQRERCHRGDR
jgi:T5SS/PEP-CTERM-associated repeat protein